MAPPYNAVDAHTHLDFPAFDGDRDAVVARARAAGVGGFVICGADPEAWDRAASVGRSLGAAVCLGIHPWWTPASPDALSARMADLARRDDLDGIGEIGLDFHRAHGDEERAAQRAALAAQLELAHDRDLPIVLHVVRAHRDAFAALAARDVPRAGGLVHAWSGGAEWVRTALDLGLHLSFGAALQRSANAQEALRLVPDDRLLLETDCPDQPLGGAERGEPAHLIDVARIAADARGTSPEALLARCAANARALFPRLSDART